VPSAAFQPLTVAADDAVKRESDAAQVPDGELLDLPAPPSRVASPAATVEPSPPAGPVHTVRPGDTLWQIAAWHRADLQLVLRWNVDSDPRHLVAGQRILVPGGRPMPKLRPTSTARRAEKPRASVQVRRHVWPLPVRGLITTRFSAAHPGIDIANGAGTLVRAIAGGTVTWAGWKNNGGGYVVVIRHADGMISTYNHNLRVLVRRGQVVSAGQQVAKVGASGWATGPHLDLRIKMGGRLLDPLRLDWAR
jgi:LysM repeat protein